MAKAKKKYNPAEAKAQAMRHKKRFMERIAYMCDMLAGPGIFKKFPPAALEQIYESRYPVLKAKAAPGSDMSKSLVIQFNKLMNRFMEDQFIGLTNGNKVPLNLLFSEGLILINYVSVMSDNYFAHADQVRESLSDYFPETESHDLIMDMMATLMQDVTLFLSDYNRSIIKADINQTAACNMLSQHNDIMIHEFKTEKSSMIIDGEKRVVYRLGWVDPELKQVWSKIKPSQLGFQSRGIDMPLDVYIQQHALNRLQERIDITPGIMHSIVFLTFEQDDIEYHRENSRSLVPFYISDEKVGYLLVTLDDNRFIIRTFLFLTNDNTPEGRKLQKLIDLEKEDKKHLMIDKLSTFNAYHIHQNEKLSKLFTDAGCGSLLKLSHLQEFSQHEISDKDPESILKYLADAEYFTGQAAHPHESSL
ncbi:hypothetical protein [Pedobacter deserti]|uniref:hypothetical protein n=1 Tax=Pedobacter deserti TaxID=2817382 RepID=UPI00210C03D7|nr:hypothetical protein [Pedobacter sp. SYSU D00382]